MWFYCMWLQPARFAEKMYIFHFFWGGGNVQLHHFCTTDWIELKLGVQTTILNVKKLTVVGAVTV